MTRWMKASFRFFGRARAPGPPGLSLISPLANADVLGVGASAEPALGAEGPGAVPLALRPSPCRGLVRAVTSLHRTRPLRPERWLNDRCGSARVTPFAYCRLSPPERALPRFRAQTAASRRLFRFSLRSRFLMWTFTVASEIPSWRAISLLLCPSARLARIWFSRSVSSASSEAGAAAEARVSTAAIRLSRTTLPRAASLSLEHRSSGSRSFSRYPSAPARIACSTSRSSSDTVSMMQQVRRFSFLMPCSVAMPDRPFMFRSISTMSGSTWLTSSIPRTPSQASPTNSRSGSDSISCATPRRNRAWSSISSTRVDIGSTIASSRRLGRHPVGRKRDRDPRSAAFPGLKDELASQRVRPFPHDTQSVMLIIRLQGRQAAPVVLDHDAHAMVLAVAEGHVDFLGVGMPDRIGDRLAHDLQHVELLVDSEAAAGQLVVQRNDQVVALRELVREVLQRGGDAAAADLRAEGADQLPDLAIRAVQSVPQFLGRCGGARGRRTGIQAVLQPCHLDFHVRERLSQRIRSEEH